MLAFAREHLNESLTEKRGTHELFNANAVAFFRLQHEMHDGLYAEAEAMMPQFADYLAEAKRFSLMRKDYLLSTSSEMPGVFSYDFPALLECDFAEDPRKMRRDVEI